MNARSLLALLFGLCLMAILTACSTTAQVKKSDGEQPTSGTISATVFDTPGEHSGITLSGTLHELTYDEPLIFGAVGVYHEGKLIAGIETDFDGHFQKEIPWDAEQPFPEEFDVKLAEEEPINCYWIPEYYPPIYQQDQLSSGRTFSSDDIRRSPTRGR